MAEIEHRPCDRNHYQKGCKCPACVASGDTRPHKETGCPTCLAANRAYSRRNKRLKTHNGGAMPAGLPQDSIRVERDPEKLVETLVRQEIDLLPARDKMPGMAAALAMARILDDPSSVPQHPGAAARLQALLDRVRRGAGVGSAEPEQPDAAEGMAPARPAENPLQKQRREAAERREARSKAEAEGKTYFGGA